MIRAVVDVRVAASLIAALFSSGCGPGSAEVVVPPVEIRIAGGDGQFGTTGALVQAQLHVVLTSARTQLPIENVSVQWSVDSGSAEIEGTRATLSDASGSARAFVRFGSEIGPVEIRATVQDQEGASVVFGLEAVDRPLLTSLEPLTADPGDTVTLRGENFSPSAEQNTVLFSGVRGRVTSSTRTSITAVVPTCLPERTVQVTTQLGVVASDELALEVGPGGEVLPLEVGGVHDAADPDGFACTTVSGEGGASYLISLQSTSRLGAATHPFTLVGLAAGENSVPAVRVPASATMTPEASMVRGPGKPQAAWDLHLREAEAAAVRLTDSTVDTSLRSFRSPTGPVLVPTEGERRSFSVYAGPGVFEEIEAVAEFVGARAAFFVDVDAPSGGYTRADLERFSDQFDAVIHPTVTDRFGSASDLDGNDRIVVLLTPVVNRLTPRGAAGFVGGFFFGVDLLPDREGSNSAEIFYALVPDAAGVHSDPRPKDNLIALTPAILAHEFQHMVHFNERILTREAEGNEAVWLSEGLAQFAEELVARALEEEGDTNSAGLFRTGARERVRRYLEAPDTVSVLIASGQGGLAERGAGFLHVMYLADRFGEAVVTELTRTTRTGVDNVEAETGTPWPDLLSDWWSATWLDGTGLETGARSYPTVDLRAYLGDPFPVDPDDLGSGDFERTGSVRSASVRYYIVNPAASGTTTLRLGGSAGGQSSPQAEMGIRIVRIR